MSICSTVAALRALDNPQDIPNSAHQDRFGAREHHTYHPQQEEEHYHRHDEVLQQTKDLQGTRRVVWPVLGVKITRACLHRKDSVKSLVSRLSWKLGIETTHVCEKAGCCKGRMIFSNIGSNYIYKPASTPRNSRRWVVNFVGCNDSVPSGSP